MFIAKQCNLAIDSYFDIGANHPFEYSNTFLFYQNGARGVCVEPIKSIADFFCQKRKRDKVLVNVVSSKSVSHDFYVLEPNTLSTADPVALRRALETPGAFIKEKLSIPAISLDELFSNFGVPSLLCLDVEGGDLDVLKSWSMCVYRPPILCVEDLEYSAVRGSRKPTGVTDYLVSNGYMLFANTFINSVLVDERLWRDSR